MNTPPDIRNATRGVELQRVAWAADDAHVGTFCGLCQAEDLLEKLRAER